MDRQDAPRRDFGSPEGRRRAGRDRPDPRDARAWSDGTVYVSARGEPRRVLARPMRNLSEADLSFEDLTALAEPVRHEANNLLAAIGGTADILLRTAQTDRDRARADRLREATSRLETLLKAYISLATPPPGQEGADGAQTIALMRPLIALILGPGRLLEIEVAAGLPRLATPPAALQAGILRMVRGAATALPPGHGLRLVLSAAPDGAMLAAAPIPDGPGEPPVFLAAAKT